MSFISEVKRRNVIRVALAYGAVSWLIIQLVTTVEEPLGLPSWFDTFVIVCLAVGFPVAVVLAWAFELTPEGLKPTESVVRETSITPETGRRLTHITIGVLATAVVLLLVDRFVLDHRNSLLPNSVAVLPFANLSPDRGDAYFASGLHEEILNQLAKLRNMNVIARTTMIQYEGTEKSIEEIAQELNVETVMEASVRFADGLVRVTTQLIDGESGVHLWSDTYEQPFDNIFAIESDIAMNVANAMAVEFSIEEQRQIEEIPTDSVEAYRLALSARVQLARGTTEGAALAVGQIDEAVRLDPESPFLWSRKAITSVVATRNFPERREELLSEAEAAVDRALQIDASYGDAYVPLAMVANNRGDWISVEQNAQKVTALGGTPNDLVDAVFDMQVGETQQSLDLIEAMRQRDPLNASVWAWVVYGQDATGDAGASLDTYGEGIQLFTDWLLGHINALVTNLGAGDSERALNVIRAAPFIPYSEHFSRWSDAPDTALVELNQIDAEGSGVQMVLAIFAAYFGDDALAIRVLRDAMESDPTSILWVWRPLFRDVRQHEDFKDLMREQGLVSYWQTFGWPDICRPLGNDDFECS